MKLSEHTVDVLKNCATINMGLFIRPGNKLRTCSPLKNIFVEAEIEESFDKDMGLYDLNKLLALLSMKKGDPEIEVEDKALAFKGLGSGKIRIRFSEPNVLVYPSTKNPNPEYEVNFTITQEVLNWINSVASILKCPNIVLKGEDGEITLWATDTAGLITDDASIKLEGKTDHTFTAVFNMDWLKMMPGSYDVQLSSIGLIKCAHKTKKITYWIAMEEKKSEFDGKSMKKGK